MANLIGSIDVETSAPTLMQTPNGAVILNFDGLSLRFRTPGHYEAWCEQLDRQQVAMKAQQVLDVGGYHDHLRAVKAERDALRSIPGGRVS